MRLLFVIAAAAAAATTFATDGNDVRGKLDLKSVAITRDASLINVKLGTYDRWSSKLLAGSGQRPGKKRLTILYDVNGDRRADYTGRIVYSGGRLSLWIKGRHTALEAVRVRRPNKKTISFTHPVDALVKDSGDINVAFTSKTCAHGCADRLPDRGWLAVVIGPKKPPPPPAK